MMPYLSVVEKKHRSRKPRKRVWVSPAELVEAFDGDGILAIAAATMLTSAGPQVDEFSVTHRMTGERLDRNFLRSAWYRRICDGCGLDPVRWKAILREGAAHNGNGNHNGNHNGNGHNKA